MNNDKNPMQKINQNVKNSITFKIVTIGILSLLLLIPTKMIDSIIYERISLQNQATHEISTTWANAQEIRGPILTIPVVYEWTENEQLKSITKNWYIMPDELLIDGKIVPEKLNRGIYDIIVYTSDLAVSGTFNIEKKLEQNNLKEILYDKAFLTIGISDLRGIQNKIDVQWDGDKFGVEPGIKIPKLVYSGVTVSLPDLTDKKSKSIKFNFDLDLQGSRNISFIPLGGTTEVNLISSWNTPKFDGNFLPDHRDLTNDGFVANWKILQLNRNFPQSWVYGDFTQKIQESSFRTELIVPLDNYQKVSRSSKYAIMTIGLTFLVFFLVEVISKRKIHPFQYALVGIALCLFYILLVSITEHISFDKAFGISALGIITLITFYSASVFKSSQLTGLLSIILLGIYGFLFVTLQLADYALLMGGIGLTLILGVTMFFTRKINWYQIGTAKESVSEE